MQAIASLRSAPAFGRHGAFGPAVGSRREHTTIKNLLTRGFTSLLLPCNTQNQTLNLIITLLHHSIITLDSYICILVSAKLVSYSNNSSMCLFGHTMLQTNKQSHMINLPIICFSFFLLIYDHCFILVNFMRLFAICKYT